MTVDAAEMKMADAAPAGESGGIAEPPSQPNAAAITAACVAATGVAMERMQQQMQAAGHAPPGV